jgi:hypothetical protein
VLALEVAARHGHEAPSRLWADVIDGALSRQREDGGFFYRSSYWPEVSGTMTTAGLTTLHVALTFLEEAGQHPAQQKLARDGIENGWSWLDARFSASGGPMGHAGVFEDRYPDFGRSDHHHYYYLYGMERVATFAGRETVGGVPWYPAIATEMLSHESVEGGWGNLENTCLAMLVLRRATFSGVHAPPPELTEKVAGDEQAEGVDVAAHPGLAEDDDVAVWAYTTDEPRRGWFEPDFDDSRWPRGEGGFSGGGALGLVSRTPWDTHDLWVRRSFSWSPRDGDVRLFVIHDDSVQIWVNGEEAATGVVWSGARYVEYAISPAAQRSLHNGDNVIAACVHDSGGGRSLDIRFERPTGLHEFPEFWLGRLPRPDVPFVRRWDLLGPFDDESDEALLELALPPAVSNGRKLGKRNWSAHRSLGSRLSLDEAVGSEPGSITYASVWLHVEEEVEAALWLGVAGGVRVWLDDAPMALHHEHGSAHPDTLRAPMTLRAGANHLVLLLEHRGPACPVIGRVSTAEGDVVPALRYALAGEAADDRAIALAQPDLFDLTDLARRLPVAPASSLRFDRPSDIGFVAFSGVRERDPRWIARASAKLPEPRPAVAARGVLSLWPPSTDRPARMLLRVQIGAKARTLTATVSLAEDATAGGHLRLSLHDGTQHILLETDVTPAVAGDRAGFTRFPVDVGAHAGKDALWILEWTALPGHDAEPLFIDQLGLR